MGYVSFFTDAVSVRKVYAFRHAKRFSWCSAAVCGDASHFSRSAFFMFEQQVHARGSGGTLAAPRRFRRTVPVSDGGISVLLWRL